MNNGFEPMSTLSRPYTGEDDGSCKVDKSNMAANLVKNGPLAVGISSFFMATYQRGVSSPYICGKHLDHGVLLVGYGSAGYAKIRFKEKPYWIIKNSWGEVGYYHLCRRGAHARKFCDVDLLDSTVAAVTN